MADISIPKVPNAVTIPMIINTIFDVDPINL